MQSRELQVVDGDDAAVAEFGTPVAPRHRRAMPVRSAVGEVFGRPFTSTARLRDGTIAMPTGSETALPTWRFPAQAGSLDAVRSLDERHRSAVALEQSADSDATRGHDWGRQETADRRRTPVAMGQPDSLPAHS